MICVLETSQFLVSIANDRATNKTTKVPLVQWPDKVSNFIGDCLHFPVGTIQLTAVSHFLFFTICRQFPRMSILAKFRTLYWSCSEKCVAIVC